MASVYLDNLDFVKRHYTKIPAKGFWGTKVEQLEVVVKALRRVSCNTAGTAYPAPLLVLNSHLMYTGLLEMS